MTTTIADKPNADVRPAVEARRAEIAAKRAAANDRNPFAGQQAPAVAHTQTTHTVPDKVGNALKTLATKADIARERYGPYMGGPASHTPASTQPKGWMERS